MFEVYPTRHGSCANQQLEYFSYHAETRDSRAIPEVLSWYIPPLADYRTNESVPMRLAWRQRDELHLLTIGRRTLPEAHPFV